MENISVNIVAENYVPENLIRRFEVKTAQALNQDVADYVNDLAVMLHMPATTVQCHWIEGANRIRFADLVNHRPGQDGEITIICNSDIVISPMTIVYLSRLYKEYGQEMHKVAFALSRYDGVINPQPFHRPDSQDAWVFFGPVPETGTFFDYTPGVPGCDNKFCYELSLRGYRLYNCAAELPIYHLHYSEARTYTGQDRIEPPYKLVEPESLWLHFDKGAVSDSIYDASTTKASSRFVLECFRRHIFLWYGQVQDHDVNEYLRNRINEFPDDNNVIRSIIENRQRSKPVAAAANDIAAEAKPDPAPEPGNETDQGQKTEEKDVVAKADTAAIDIGLAAIFGNDYRGHRCRVLHIANNASYPQGHANPISSAFTELGFNVTEIDWHTALTDRNAVARLNDAILSLVRLYQPALVFMQIQGPGVILPETVSEIAATTRVVHWSGDVRSDLSFYRMLAGRGCICLFNNMDDVRAIDQEFPGMSDYLQVAFDPALFSAPFPSPKYSCRRKSDKITIGMIGHNYTGLEVDSAGGDGFPQSRERVELVKMLSDFVAEYPHLLNPLKLAGNGWKDIANANVSVIPYPEQTSFYQDVDIAICHNHFHREGYTSDRLMIAAAAMVPLIYTSYYGGMFEDWSGTSVLGFTSIDVLREQLRNLMQFIEALDDDKVLSHGHMLIPAPDWRRLTQYRDWMEQKAYHNFFSVHHNHTWKRRVRQMLLQVFSRMPLKKEEMNSTRFNPVQLASAIKTAPRWKKYSQSGEEGILHTLIEIIGAKSHYLVDFGAGDGFHLSNTRFLIEQGWRGLLMDGDNKGNAEVKAEHITADNICNLFAKYEVPKEFDLLSIDIDGNDYWVLDRILGGGYRPQIIIAEFNGTITQDRAVTIAYNPDHVWKNNDYYGASFSAFCKLAIRHGYRVIGQNDGLNLYMVPAQILTNADANLGLEYVVQQYHAHFPGGNWVNV